MKIEPKILSNVCIAAHPKGLKADLERQINYVKQQGRFPTPKKVLVIGSSMGYGLATRLVCAFAGGAKTIGVSFEKPSIPSKGRTASPGWYTNEFLKEILQEQDLYVEDVNGDAFSNQTKQQVVDIIKKTIKTVDCVIYSIASPVRTDAKTGQTYRSVIKSIGQDIDSKNLDPFNEQLKHSHVDRATQEEIENTVKVMGGEDWYDWMDYLNKAKVLDQKVSTVAYSYTGGEITKIVYRDGTIGEAKKHLEQTVEQINQLLQALGGKAYVAMNKALITRASAVIPLFPLYVTALYKVMKKQGSHEDTIMQMVRLFQEKYHDHQFQVDDQGFIRMDDWELDPKVQQEVINYWEYVNDENFREYLDIEGFKKEFFQLHGFGISGIDYSEDVQEY